MGFQREDFSLPLTSWLECGAMVSLKGERLLVGFGSRSWLTEEELQEEGRAFYFPDFFLENPSPCFTHAEMGEWSSKGLLSSLRAIAAPAPPSGWRWENEELFAAAFEELQEIFSRGELLKAVPYLFARGKIGRDPKAFAALLASLMEAAQRQGSFLYGFWDEEGGMVGASPELFFLLSGLRLETCACAATAPIGALTTDPKLVKEHRLVIEGIRESLAPYGPLTVGATRTVSFPPLEHLITPLEVELYQPVPLRSLVRALHPTPALGAFPKSRGEGWLQSYGARLPRGRYGAPAGALSFNQGSLSADLYVAIRNVQWQGESARIGIGCGVVAESRWEKEWEEVNLKLSAVKMMLQPETRGSPSPSSASLSKQG